MADQVSASTNLNNTNNCKLVRRRPIFLELFSHPQSFGAQKTKNLFELIIPIQLTALTTIFLDFNSRA